MPAVALIRLTLLGVTIIFAARSFGLGNWDFFAARLNQIDLITWGVIAVAFWRLSLADPGRLASRREQALCLGVAALWPFLALIPAAVGIGAAFALLGLILLAQGPQDRNLRAAAICLLALGTHLSLAPIVFRVFLDPILGIDRFLLGQVFAILRPDIIWSDAGFRTAEGFGITLVGACSSFAGISVAVVVHIGWAMRVRTRLTRLDPLAILLTAILATLINITRLVLTGWNPEGYAFWHGTGADAPGLAIVWVLQTAAILTGGYLSAYWAGRHEP